MDTDNTQETGRHPDGRFKAGMSGNPKGRPPNTLKDYLKRKLSEMEDWEKEEWLKENNISGELKWRMAEGQPHQTEDITSDGKALPTPILGGASKEEKREEKQDE